MNAVAAPEWASRIIIDTREQDSLPIHGFVEAAKLVTSAAPRNAAQEAICGPRLTNAVSSSNRFTARYGPA